MNFSLPIIALAALIPLLTYPLRLRVSYSGQQTVKRTIMQHFYRFLLLYLCSFFISFLLLFSVIHQAHIGSLLAMQPNFSDPSSEAGAFYAQAMEKYGHLHRSFGHGALHGAITAILFVFPILTFIHLSPPDESEPPMRAALITNGIAWTIRLSLMGGILCAFA